MVRHETDPAVINERRHGPRREHPGRRAEDEAAEMGTDDLRELVSALERALEREREDRLRDMDALKTKVDAYGARDRVTLEAEADRRIEEARQSGRVRLALVVAGFALAVLAWFGPTRLKSLILTLFGAG